MHKTLTAPLLAALLAIIPAQLLANDHIELVDLMSALQRYSHKIHLSLAADNNRLAHVYADEMKEVIETLEDIDEDDYDNHPIAKLVDKKLEPAFKALEHSLKGMNDLHPKAAFDRMIEACNSCHKATKHDFIRVEMNDTNPYLQSFAPTK